MRDTFVLLTARSDAAEVRRRILELEEISGGSFFRYFTVGDCVFGVDLGGSVIDEYDAEELQEVSERVGDVEPVLVEYQNMECAAAMMRRCLTGVGGILDTNYGDLVEYPEVLRRIDEDPDWTLKG